MATRNTTIRQSKPEWADYIEDRFGTVLYGNTFARWQRYMDDPSPEGLGECPSDDTLLEVLQWIKSQKVEPSGKLTVDKMMSWCKWYWKEHSYKDETIHADCALCRKGWVDLWPDYTAEEIGAREDRGYLYNAVVPCLCSKGSEITKICEPYKSINDTAGLNELNKAMKLAHEQIKAINRSEGEV